ncbi:MAG: CYTH domain-containing protein [Bacillota bacterium]|nr:CYTH domain-containing protein [Bacillota bacterium]
MEIEMKYALPNKQVADSIWEDEYLTSLSDAASAENLVMKAVYFDTEDGLLSKNNISVRVRAEGDRNFATLKANGTHKDGMFTRDELNVPILDDTSFMSLNPKLFAGSDVGNAMIEIVGDKPLINLLEMHFVRRRKRIAYASSIMELAIDIGEIITDKGEKPISEMEIELFAGSQDAIKTLGDEIANKYDLKIKNTSKLKDGLEML